MLLLLEQKKAEKAAKDARAAADAADKEAKARKKEAADAKSVSPIITYEPVSILLYGAPARVVDISCVLTFRMPHASLPKAAEKIRKEKDDLVSGLKEARSALATHKKVSMPDPCRFQEAMQA